MIDLATVQKVAHLARLQLTEAEQALFTEQLDHILSYIDQLSQLNTEGVSPTTRALELTNVTRPDEPQPHPDPERLLAQAPQREEAFYRVPKIGS
ncbi:Asp-tRNA(Asn)/Glu-tRNA(Gln) amidotransferase subunit GatC [Anthocerotibacter panamensis]|uniref:Asp-tRNA(Asn)/Glu-tRNA(Gln) amidotransferase subunit GatC n=1 Tax=Anthocerotibacter panamensis TaxID=2857077 RepID=UPI001C40893A|nr:Asp-tRNA(Asn)/Glu-tRNA(Gln) amidotransferase subunit GatC [Anthocerotibacter panamensis]